MDLFINTIRIDPFHYFAWVLVVMFSICVHEYAHARTALQQGDDTAAWLGHLSLNPLIQMGVPSIVMLLVIGIAWGAVPVNLRNFRNRWSDAWVAAAGPLANLLLCLLFSAAAALTNRLPWAEVNAFMHLAAAANGVLFLFNLLPIPMFDGWAILSLWVPQLPRIGTAQAQSASWIALLVLWFTPLGGVVWGGGALLASRCVQGWGALLHGLA